MTRWLRSESARGWLFVSPVVLGLVLLTAYPIGMSFYYSLTDFNGLHEPSFVGVDQYAALMQDELYWQSLWNTVVYVVFAVPLGVVVALALAMLLNLKLKGQAVYRAVFFVPSIVPMVATSVLWLWLLDPQTGAVNGLLRVFGIPEPGWLGSPEWLKPSLILMSLWGVGGTMVLYLAALQDVNESLYEAARIDGATRWQQVWHVTLPSIGPVIFLTVVMGVIGGFQYFTQAYVMLGGTGGAADAGLFYCLYLFRKAFAYQDLGGASAMAWILFAIVLGATLVLFRLSRGRVHYEGA